jgi:ACS family glucarate transporter-like MFS transporter
VFILLASVTAHPVAAAVLIGLAAATCMLTTAPAWSTCVDIGREHSGTVSASMNTSGQFAAIALQPIAGYSVDWFDNWNVPFWLLGALYLMGTVCWLFIEPKKPVFTDAGARD